MKTLLAKHFHWSEDYIEWLPFFKVLLYFHAISVSEGANMRWSHTETRNKVTVEQLDDFLSQL